MRPKAGLDNDAATALLLRDTVTPIHCLRTQSHGALRMQAVLAPRHTQQHSRLVFFFFLGSTNIPPRHSG